MKGCFCGSYPRLSIDDNGRYWFVKCSACDRASIHCRTRDEAVEAWNIGGEWPDNMTLSSKGAERGTHNPLGLIDE